MARGFITGVLSGSVMAAGLGAVASVLAPGPHESDGSFVAGIATNVVMPNALSESDRPDLPRAEDAAPATPSTVLGATPDAGSLDGVEVAALRPGLAPLIASTQTDSAFQTLDTPQDQPLVGAIESGFDDPVTRSYHSMVLVLPPPADVVDLRTAPIALAKIAPKPLDVQEVAVVVPAPTPETAQSPNLTVPDTPLAERDTPRAQPGASIAKPETPLSNVVQPVSLELPADADVQIDAIKLDAPILAERSPLAPPEAPAIKRKPVVPDELAIVNRPRSVSSEASASDAVLAQVTPPPAETPRPRIGKPAVSLTGRSGGVVINRFGSPSTTDTPAAEPVAAAPQDAAAAAETDDPRPVAQHRAAFENTEDKPLMSIVLIDNGSIAMDDGSEIAGLQDFPYPLSFAVDSTLPDAQERVAEYRAKGFEVLGMIDLPPGAQPSDAETTLGVLLPQMGEIIGVLEGPGAGLQESREVADQVTMILAESGHGLIAQAKGLNTMPNLARKQGVPAAPVFRDFDSKDQDERVIRRFLDQAAFKAGQEGAVIMLGRLRPETISALLVWGLQDRAGQVALAPVSAVLLRDDL